MKKGAVKRGLFAFLAVLIFVSMASFVSADVFINEFLADGPAPEPDSEWVELFNNGSSAVSLNNWNITEQGASANLTLSISIPANGFVILVNNFTLFNSTFQNLNSTGLVIDYGEVVPSFQSSNIEGNITLYNSSGSRIDNISYSSTTENVSIGRNPDGSGIITTFTALTPGDKNDKEAPILNKWINPSANNSFIKGLVNVTVNITDAAHTVNLSLINFNNSNFSMTKLGDLFYYAWNTSLNAEKPYNITIFFNDSLRFSNTNTLFSITIDNIKPNITAPITSANSRNYANPGFNFNASVNATDINLLNVTCTLSGTTVANFSNDTNPYHCNLTSALAAATASNLEQDFAITFIAVDKANNTNTTTISFTTKHSTSAALAPKDATISNLNQSEKTIEINVSLNNTGNNPIYDAGITLDSFSSTKFSSVSGTYQNCSQNINSSQRCTATFSIRISGGTTGTHSIFWNRNWTNNNFTQIKFTQVAASTVTISNNPQMTTAANVSATIKHAQNSTVSLHINSTGNLDLESVTVTFVPGTIQSSWLNATIFSLGTVSAATNTTLDVNIAVPKYTNPGNYTGTFSIAASSVSTKTVLLIVEVPADNSWISFPNRTITHRRSDAAGIVGKFTINNTGNVGHNFTFYPPTGNLFTFPTLWNDSNIRSIYVERGEVAVVSIYHKQMSGNAPETESSFNLTFTITSKNTSQSNTTFMSLVRDDNNPNLRISTLSDNSFVKGTIDVNSTAVDLNLSRLEYSINGSLVFNSTLTGGNFTFKWNTNNGSYSDEIYKLKAIAFDSAGNVNQSEVSVTVNNTDSLPVLRASIPTINIVEDDNATLNLSLFFESIDGDTLKYNFTKPDNVTIHVTNATQIANFTPAANFTGLNYIIFTAIDTSNQTISSNNVTINVANVNDAPTTPVLTSPQSGSNVTSSAGKATLIWNASKDVDNDAITYYVFVSNDSSNIRLNATTAATNLQLANLGNNFVYYWKVLASDNLLNSSNSSIFNFTIIRDNNPVINKWTWNNTINVSSTNTSPIVAENRTLNFTINASDPDNNPINFTWFVNSSEKSSAQNFSFNLINNFTAAGNYAIKLQVQDNNSNAAEQEWQVTVTNTNREPVLDAIGNKEVLEDSTLRFNITALDLDGDSLSFTSNISSITFTNAANNSLATVNWTPTNDNVGSNSIEFRVKDSSKNASQTITITVTNTNDAPTITEFFPADNKTIAKNVGIQKFNVTFKDVDTGDDAAAYWFRNTILIASNFSNVTVTSLLEGIYNITAIVNDTTGAKARYEWKLNVTDAILGDGLTSPVLSLNETQRQNATNVAVNESTFGGIDFGNNSLNFSGVANLEDAFNISRGFVSVNAKAFPGLNKSTSVVMKGINFTKAPLIYRAPEFKSTANGIICPENVCTNITYDAANRILRFRVPGFSTYFTQTNTTNGAPVITSTPIKTATENAKYTYDAEATDPDGDVLIFSLITKPSGMSISSSTGVISWTPTTSQLGLNNVTVNVSDGSLMAEQSFNITVGKGPKLIISDLDVKVDTKTDKGMQNNTKISKEAAPGSRVEFKLEVENLFTDDEDLDIEDIDVEITIEDIDDGDDLDEDTDEFDLKSGKNEDVSIEFDIPLEVDEDIYNVIISVEGEDENQTAHEILWSLELEVEKETHEIRILKSDIIPLTISCQRQVALNAEIINTGTEDEDEVTLEITSPELGISSVTTGLELDEGTEDNRFTKKIIESISKDILEGVYTVAFNAYYDSSLSETKTVDLTVGECELTKAVKEKVKEKKPDVDVIRPKAAVEKPEAKAAEPSFKQTGEYRTLLAIMVIVFIGTAVFVVGGAYMLLKK